MCVGRLNGNFEEMIESIFKEFDLDNDNGWNDKEFENEFNFILFCFSFLKVLF